MPELMASKQAQVKPLDFSDAERAWLKQHPVIRLGIDPEFIPFEYINDQGEYSGMASDYILLLNERLGTNMVITHKNSWEKAVDEMKSGDLDVLPCVAVTDERKQFMLFSDPYIDFQRAVIMRADGPFVVNISDLEQFRVAVQRNTVQEAYLREHSSISPQVYATIKEAVLAVANGNADAFLGNLASATYWVRQLNLRNLKVAGTVSNDVINLHFAVRKDWPELIGLINKGLASISDQERKAISDKWMGLKFEPGIDYVLVWKLVGGFVLLILLVLAWNIRIRHQKILALVARDEAEQAKALLEQANLQMQQAQQELKAANLQLKQLDRLKSMFIASMSHELRTPLNSILGFTDLVLEGMAGEINDIQRGQLLRVHHAGRHLLALITDVIDISKVEAGKVVASPQLFDLADLLDEAIKTTQFDMEKKGLKLQLDIPQSISMHTDHQRLLQCVLNLLSNAIKYSKQGQVTLRAQQRGDEVLIEVTDSGIGISDDQLQQLFKPFVRLDSELAVTAGGTGLGLYLTRKLMQEVLNGTVSVSSQPGVGSCFTLRLPCRWKFL